MYQINDPVSFDPSCGRSTSNYRVRHNEIIKLRRKTPAFRHVGYKLHFNGRAGHTRIQRLGNVNKHLKKSKNKKGENEVEERRTVRPEDFEDTGDGMDILELQELVQKRIKRKAEEKARFQKIWDLLCASYDRSVTPEDIEDYSEDGGPTQEEIEELLRQDQLRQEQEEQELRKQREGENENEEILD